MKALRSSTLIKQLTILFLIAIATTLSAAVIFYSTAFRSLQEEKFNQVENTLGNMKQNTEDIASSVVLMSETVSNISYTHSFLTETNIQKRIGHQQQLNRLILKLIKSTSHITNILLVDNNGTLYSFSSFDYLLASKLDRQYEIFSPDTQSDGFSGALYLEDSDTTYYTYYQTIYDENTDKKIGACVIICSPSSLNHICTHADASHHGLFAILDSQGQILASNHPSETAYAMLNQADSSKHLTLRHDASSSTGWTYLSSVPYSELYSELNSVRYFALLLIFTLVLSFLLLASQISRGIVFPLVKIVGFLKKEPYYILHNELDVTGNSEIGTLTTNINRMLAEINDLTHTIFQNQARMYEVQLSENQARLLALRTQINPHFLYNTLASIQGLAYEKRFEEISTTATSLSYLMRYSLSDDNMASVEDEFLCIEEYLQIVDIRFPNRFTFHLQVEDGVGSFPMPRFLLQPLVENAISHGLTPSPLDGSLTLRASLLDDSILRIECIDNGVGIPSHILNELREKLQSSSLLHKQESDDLTYKNEPDGRTKIGLLNTHTRIQLIYGAPYGLSISSDSSGTSVCAEFPTRVPAPETEQMKP